MMALIRCCLFTQLFSDEILYRRRHTCESLLPLPLSVPYFWKAPRSEPSLVIKSPTYVDPPGVDEQDYQCLEYNYNTIIRGLSRKYPTADQ
ncbi:hypothetical protein J6590_075779 [Homalodisca vitripennis]|nr:hypothetical protein J6590_075779 [Homalodisca vitripennis]